MIQFVENLNALGHWLFLHFGRISIEVAILAALVGAAIVALRIKRPAIRYAFWCLVLIKPAIALLATSPVSLYWYLQPIPAPEPTPIVMPAAPPMARPPMRPAGPATPVMPPMRPPTVTPRPMPTPPPPPPEPTAWETFNIYGVGCAVWLAGVFVLFVRLVVGFAYVGFLRQSSRRQKVGLLAEAVADLRRELKIRRRVHIAVSYVAHGPVLAGIAWPTILIPNDLAEDLSQEQARLIVGHELAHVKRWDNLLLLIQRIIEVFFFFHPVIWLTGWLMRREAEAAADDKIISVGGRPADYADALARAAEVRIGLTRRMLVNTFAASESDHARRVRRILNGRVVKTSLAMGVIAVIALIVIAIVGLPGPAKRKPDTKPEGDKEMVSHIKTTEQLAAGVKREGSKVWIEGVPNEHVGGGWLGIPRGVALLLEHRGEEVEFEDVLAYSGDAFHLSIATQWQFMGYMAIPTDPVANILAAYGYDGGYHHTEPMPRGAEAIRAVTDGLLAEFYAKIDVGRPVLVGGVSDEGCGAWSVVAGYNTDALQLYHVGLDESPRWSNIRGINSPLNDETFESGAWNSQVRGAAWPGMIGHWLDNCGVYLGDKVAEPSARDVALKTLALAVQLHRAADHDGLWMTYFGASAYEQWARMMHELDYPADTLKPVPEPLWDVYDLGGIARLPEVVAVGRTAAAKFCERSAEALPEAREHLFAAATAYREEAAIAQEAFAVLLAGPDDEAEAWLSDEANREAGVTAIAQMLEKEELAVRHIQSALAATAAPAASATGRTAGELAAAVERDGSKVWIDGVPGGTFGTGWDMLARAMQTLLTYRGEKADLDELLAYSGDAFNLCHGSNWQGVSYLCAPTNIVGNMAEAYGYEYETIHNGYPFETMEDLERPARLVITERALSRIRAEIEAGRPPLVGGAEDHCGSWTLAVGYDREGPLLRHVGDHQPNRWTPIRGVAPGSTDEDFGHWNGRFRGTIRDGFVGGWQDNPAYLIKQKKAHTPTRRENVLAALARAVQLHRAPTTHIGWSGGVDYHFGRRAYEQWAAELHKLDFPADVEKALPDEAYDWYEMGNMAIQADQIVRGRSAAATFCEKAVEVLPGAKDHLLAAAQAYRQEAAIAAEAFAVFLEGTDEQRVAWLSDEAKREAGVTAIAQMLEKEQLAVGHVEAALAIVGVAAPGTGIAGGGRPMQAVQSTPVFDIPKLADMDASGSPEQWGERGLRVDVMTPFGPRMPISQFGARFRLGWDDTGLWLRATVTDDEFHSAESVEKLWANEADLILLYVIREEGEYARIVIEPGMTADQPSPRIITSAGGNGLGVRVTRERIDGGYVLQAWAPWSEVGFEPAEGAELRAQVIVLDVDKAGEDIQMGGALWYPAIGTPQNTNISHRLRLADQPSAPQVATVNAEDDRITVTAAPQQAGKTVTVIEGDRTLAEVTLATDDATGYAVASIPLPLPPLSHPLAQPTVMLDGQAIGSLNPIPLTGYGMEQDTLSLAIEAAAKALGRDADFETIACLSSNAFAPMLSVGEDCTSWWMNEAWMADRCIETVARRVGLEIREIKLPEAEGTWDDKEAMAAHRRKIAPILREIMAGGEIIVTTGGWQARQEHGFVPWGWAGIITEARDDGTILGVHPDNARTDNAIYVPGRLWALSPTEPTLSAHEADLIALQQAVNRIRGADRFQPDGPARYGLAAMDAYIEHMRTVPGFCAGCFERAPDRAWTDANDSARAVHGVAKTAASYLRRRIGTFKVEARPHIEAATRHYDRIILLLHPALTGEGGRSYQRWFNGNLEAQKRHADEVLVPVRAQLAAAADAMARALAAEGVEVTAALPSEENDPIFDLTDEFTAEQLTKLAVWRNAHGDLENCLREATTNPEFLELFRQQLALGAISGEPATIRGTMGGLEPAEDTYLTHVEMIVQAIAAGEWEGALVLDATDHRVLPAPFNGRLKAVYVGPGQEVVANATVLAELDTTELRLRLLEAQTEREHYELEKTKALRDGDAKKAQIAASRATEYEAKIDLLQLRIKQAIITSPIDGVVISKDLRRRVGLGGAVSFGDVLFEVAPPGASTAGGNALPLLLPERERRLTVLRNILSNWVDGTSGADALAKHDDDATVQRIYGLLGEHTAAKAEAVTGLVGKFTPDGDCDEKFYEWEAMKDKTTVAQKMAHHITMLDKPLWHLEYSLSVTLAGIGHGESIGDWRTPGGHLGWKNWINPKDLPRVKVIVAALEAWLAGDEAEGEVAEIVAALGERDAYREKAWLAGCLLHYLRTDGKRTDEFVEQLESDWLPLGPEGFTMDELTDSLVTGDIGWYWPRPSTSHRD